MMQELLRDWAPSLYLALPASAALLLLSCAWSAVSGNLQLRRAMRMIVLVLYGTAVLAFVHHEILRPNALAVELARISR